LKIKTKIDGEGIVETEVITVGELKKILENVDDNKIIVLRDDLYDYESLTTQANVIMGLKDNRYYDLEYGILYDDESLDDEEIKDRQELLGCIVIAFINEKE
jgi:hypothetical protein